MERACLWTARIAAVGVAVFAPFFYWRGGLIDIEALVFIPHYLSDHTFLAKVFDPVVTDFGNYQARALSFVFDFVDAHVFRLLLRADRLTFIPLSAVLGALLTAAVFFAGARRFRGVQPLTCALLLLVYFSNYTFISTSGMYYRSAKPLVAPLVMAAMFLVASIVAGTASRTRLGHAILFTLLCFMGLLDPQGAMYVGTLALALVLAGWKESKARRLAWIAGGALVILVLFDVAGGPFLIRWLNGYSPSFAYQQVPLDQLARHPKIFLQGGKLMFEAVGTLMGGVTYPLAAVLTAALVWWLMWQGARTTAAVVAVILAVQAVVYVGMITRAPEVYRFTANHLQYYTLPFQALCVSGLVVIAHQATAVRRGWHAAALNVLLVGCTLSNVAHWNADRRIAQETMWFLEHETQTRLVRESLNADRPDPLLEPDYRSFYEYCRHLRRR